MTWLYVFLAVEAVSFFLCMKRWSKRYLAGAYADKNGLDACSAFFGYLTMGLVLVMALAFLAGADQLRREQAAAARAKELENAQRDVLRLVGKD